MLRCKNIRSCYDTLTQKMDMCCNRFYSKKLLKHRMVPCNKDISIHLDGFEVPYIMDYLSRKILLKADTKFLFRESGRQSRQKPIREYFTHKGAILSEDAEDIHEYCALYKRWMRTLSDPWIPVDIQKIIIRRILQVGPELRSFHLKGMAELLVSGGLTQSLVCLIHCIFSSNKLSISTKKTR
ncbi:uncharacterized protein LOC100902165 [Galendromus occidentalis]|uniref:Uncharacterized protein LOC100902165 n=1 Tax=Galendromus occidentalis TaxID=34638 RepID=A0AAJ7SE36_9ACAR|nr:uncharacterized protein LOC100902165 [Galendromus occidentalis]